MRRFIYIILFFLVFLSACTTAKPVTEDQIFENLKGSSFITDNSDRIESFKVINREFRNDKKSEYIHAEIIFDSEYAKVAAYFDVNCNLGDDGWYILDSSLVNYDLVSLSEPNEADVFSFVDSFARKNLSKSGLSLGNKSVQDTVVNSDKTGAAIVVNIDFEDPYVHEYGEFIIDASFDLEVGWTYDYVTYDMYRQWKFDERTFELVFTSIRIDDANWKNYNDIYFTGTFIENYWDGNHSISNNLVLRFRNNNFGYTSIEKENDWYGTNQFLLTYGSERYKTHLLQITYNYSNQEYEAYRFSGSRGYFKLKN